MKAFHNDPKIKEFYLARVRAHRLADEIVKGQYWEEGKGCAVGCTIHGSDHGKYEIELGIPRVLAKLEDNIFENLPNDRAKLWPEEFVSAINVGADLFDVWPKFAVWLLTDDQHGVIKYAKTEQQKSAIQAVSDCYSNYKNVTRQEWWMVAAAATAAADDAARAAARSAADDVLGTNYSVMASMSAARTALHAVHASSDAVNAATRTAAAASHAAAHAYAYNADNADYDARLAAEATAYRAKDTAEKVSLAQADKLLELLREQR